MTDSVVLNSILEEQMQARKDQERYREEFFELKAAVITIADQQAKSIEQTTKTNEQLEKLVSTFTLAEAHRSSQDGKIGTIDRNQMRFQNHTNERFEKLESRTKLLELDNRTITTKQKGIYTIVGTIITTAISVTLFIISKMLK